MFYIFGLSYGRVLILKLYTLFYNKSNYLTVTWIKTKLDGFNFSKIYFLTQACFILFIQTAHFYLFCTYKQ